MTSRVVASPYDLNPHSPGMTGTPPGGIVVGIGFFPLISPLRAQ
ncbi:hypothetical protein [Musicola paradisiaca]|nr:hypothetical protein [Musicola paradisiaca]